MKQNGLSLSQPQCILYLIKPYSTLPHACYVSVLLCIHSTGCSTARAKDRTFNIVSKRYFTFVHGTVRHYHIRCVIHTVLSNTLGRARLIFLKTPAMLMNAMIYKTMFDKVEAFHTHQYGITSMRRQYSNSLYLSIAFTE